MVLIELLDDMVEEDFWDGFVVGPLGRGGRRPSDRHRHRHLTHWPFVRTDEAENDGGLVA